MLYVCSFSICTHYVLCVYTHSCMSQLCFVLNVVVIVVNTNTTITTNNNSTINIIITIDIIVSKFENY